MTATPPAPAMAGAGTLAEALLAALQLPAQSQLTQRIPKKLLLEHIDTAADRRLITDAVEAIHWRAALKPHTVGVPAYRDAQREYLEIAVLHTTARAGTSAAQRTRLAELTHRAIPYPVVLLLDAPEGGGLHLSLAHKRWAQREAGKVVLDGDVRAVCLPGPAGPPQPHAAAFANALALRRQPQTHMHALYDAWMACLLALLVARHTGVFSGQIGIEPASIKGEQLSKYEQLQTEAARLRAQASRARQMAQRVELNLALQRVQQQIEQLHGRL